TKQRSRSAVSERWDSRVLDTARNVAATIGSDFFRAVAHHLARALPADSVVIGEFIGPHNERVKTVGGDLDGKPAAFEYETAGTAAVEMLRSTAYQCRAEATRRYPSDPLIMKVGAQACI